MKIHSTNRGKKNTGSAVAEKLSKTGITESKLQRENNTGLPDNLKSGIENLSGHTMDGVKVHYNSPQPEQLQAHAYAQGTDIHLASGQDSQFPHEAWHVVQQKEGRVKPAIQLSAELNISDDKSLEHEADILGNKARQLKTALQSTKKNDDAWNIER